MSHRMQILVEEGEFRKMKAAARAAGQSVAEWVRGHLRQALRESPAGDQHRKLDAIRAAAQNRFPTADIEQMLEEIELGYRAPR